jgi:L-2,4-diaminobutyrate decarboxylase
MSCSSYRTYSRKWVSEPERPSICWRHQCSACRLDAPTAFAHMDPPTPWLTWAMALWNSSLNQNLLHSATAPVARHIEEKVIAWLAPFFGMQGGHMTPGSTMANLTALWSARECAGVAEVVTSGNAHLSIAKAAHLLGLRYRSLPSSLLGALLPEGLSGDSAAPPWC